MERRDMDGIQEDKGLDPAGSVIGGTIGTSFAAGETGEAGKRGKYTAQRAAQFFA